MQVSKNLHFLRNLSLNVNKGPTDKLNDTHFKHGLHVLTSASLVTWHISVLAF